MIRIRKSPNSPVELAQHGYRNDAVRRAVHADQDGKCFNGANPRMLKLKEEAFRSDFQAALTRFNDTLSAYLMNPTEGTRSRVQADLSPQSEFLGFKYWIILSDEGLARVFSSDIVWNKS